MASVVFDHVAKRYGSAPPTIADLCLEARDGELLVLVGPSGCGKSTALRMIAGLEEITSGSLYLGERRVNDVPAKERDVAMVFQSYALYPHMTCFENMAFALTLRKVPRAEITRRVTEAAEILAIEHLLQRKPRELSGGQRQRVAIGRAIVREPRVFLMDEPLSNLDAKLRAAMRGELKRLHRRLGTTIVYVTHDQTEALTLGDRVAVLRSGELLQVGTPADVWARPASSFVAAFLGSVPMNLLPGRVDEGTLVVAGARVPVPVAGARDVVVGIRPEALVPGAPLDLALEGRVELSEWTGAETFVHVTTDAGRVVCRATAEAPLAMGTGVRLGAHARDLHLFDAKTEARLA